MRRVIPFVYAIFILLPSQASAFWGNAGRAGGSLFLLDDAYSYSPYSSYSLSEEKQSVPWMCFDIRNRSYKRSRPAPPAPAAQAAAPKAEDAEPVVISIPAPGPPRGDCRVLGNSISCGKRRGAKTAIVKPLSIVVLPFRNETADASLQWLSVGMQDVFTGDLGYIGDFKAIPLRDYLPASAKTVKALSLYDAATAAKLGKKLSAGQVWLGSYKKAAPDIIEVEVRGYDAVSAKEVFRKRVKAPQSRLIAACDSLLMEILRETPVDIGPVLIRLMAAKTDSLPAWRHYAMGLEGGLGPPRTGVADPVDLLWEAVVEDPEYAEAWDGMGWALMRAGDYRGAEQAFSYALKLKPHMPDAKLGLQRLSNR